MFVSGFTIVRNAIKYDYPVVEAISSILPLCDEVIIAVGDSEDNTLELIRKIKDPKIRIVETTWDDSLREGGKLLSIETNKALDHINPNADWAFYIQADECIHEKDYSEIRNALTINLSNKEVDGLLFQYKHFFGSYNYVGDSRIWYRNEVRIIRNDKRIRSYKDAQGFRVYGEKPKVKHSGGTVYHYGWVKHPKQQQDKQRDFNKLWHDDAWVASQIGNQETYDYSNIDSLTHFVGSHPKVMKDRIAEKNWDFKHDFGKKRWTTRVRLLMLIEKLTGWRIGEYKNYKLI